MAVVTPTNTPKIYFKTLEILSVACEYIFLSNNSVKNDEEHFRQIHLQTVFVQGVNRISGDPVPTRAFVKVQSI